jgi:anti-sigma factor RsiW
MNGPHLDDELSALLDGELHGEEHDDAVAHLRECAFCTSELAAVERTRSLVRSLPMVYPPNALEPRPERRANWWDGLVGVAAAAVTSLLLNMAPDQPVTVEVAGLVDTHSSITGPGPNIVNAVLTDKRAGQILDTAAADGDVDLRLIPTPLRLEGDYQRLGVYRRGDVVHEFFSDGVHTLSVFAEAGDLDDGSLPANGRAVVVHDKLARHFEWPGADVLVWESGGVVYTAVGNGPAEDVQAAAASMPASEKLSVGERLRRGCRALVDAITG